MIQDPNPIDPITPGKLTFTINGEKYSFDEDTIPALFAAYVAADRARYYAGVDAARCETNAREEFDASFVSEVRHGLRDRSELEDWMSNNMDVLTSDVSAIGVLYLHPAKQLK